MNILSKITKKHIVIISFIFLVIIIILTAKYISDNMLFQPHGKLAISSVPTELTIKYHDTVKKIVKENTELPIPVGEYDITFSAEGFANHTEKVSVKDKGVYTVAFQLTPQTDAAKKHLEENSLKYDPVYQDIYTLDKKKYIQSHPEEADLASKLPYTDRGYSIVVCDAYRKDTLEKDRLGLCIDIAEEDRSDKLLTAAAIEKVKELTSNYSKPYDLKISGSIYPTQEEIDEKLVYDCSQDRNIAFCYEYYYQDYSASEH